MKQFAKLLAASIMLASSAGCSDNLSSLLTGELRTSLDSAVSRGRVALGRDSSAAHHDTGSDTSGVRHSGDSTEVRHSGDTTEVHHGGGGLSDSTEVHRTGDGGDTTHISQHDGGIDSTRHGGGSSGGGSNGGGGGSNGGGSSDSTGHGGGHGESGGHH